VTRRTRKVAVFSCVGKARYGNSRNVLPRAVSTNTNTHEDWKGQLASCPFGKPDRRTNDKSRGKGCAVLSRVGKADAVR